MSVATTYRSERAAVRATIDSLTDAELENAPTLCAGWAPRDVMAHLLGIDASLTTYFTKVGRIKAANAEIVERYKSLPTAELRETIRRWADKPAAHAMLLAPFFLGDLGIHHQDIVRGLGRTRTVPPAVGAAILREGLVLGGLPKLRTYRVSPTDGGRALGRGEPVRGTREALGLWLSGRRSVENELTFG